MSSEERAGTAMRIRLAREQAGLSQGQVARQLGIHRPTISEIEAGHRRVSSEELVAFARLYDVEISWLATGAAELPSAAAELAARELAKLSKDDLTTIMRLLRTLRRESST